MFAARRWSAYHPGYRSQQMQVVAQWLSSGISCAVVGMAGCGKSNFLGFLSGKPDALTPYLGELAGRIIPIPVDLNSVPAGDLAAFFRVILRAFYETRDRFAADIQALIAEQYSANRAAADPFLSQSALREILLHFQCREQRVVLLMDRFDRFSDQSPAGMADTLRNFRDSFKDTLCYVVAMRQAPRYILNPDILGELYEIFDLHVCWLGAMGHEDARHVIAQELLIPETSLEETLVAKIYDLTGGYPSLLKAVCQRYLDNHASPSAWEELLKQDDNVRYRLEEIWQGLTQQEQVTLYTIAQSQANSQIDHGLLLEKGLVVKSEGIWQIASALLRNYAATVGKLSRGTLWQDEETGVLYQGITPLQDLKPTEAALLTFFVQNPYKKHTYTEIIEAVWSEDNPDGVSNEALAQHIRGLRKCIEPTPSRPIYVVNWRGKPEGGYQFFAEGKPVE